MKKMLFKVCLITLLILCNLSVYSTTCMADGSLDDVMNNGNSFLNAGSESSTMIDQNDLKSLSNFRSYSNNWSNNGIEFYNTKYRGKSQGKRINGSLGNWNNSIFWSIYNLESSS